MFTDKILKLIEHSIFFFNFKSDFNFKSEVKFSPPVNHSFSWELFS